MKCLLTLLLMLAAGMGHAAEGGFARDVAPLLERHCASCHLMGTEPGALALHVGAAHASLVGRQASGADMLLVTPGDPEASYLLHKLRGTHLEVGGSGTRMPFAAPALSKSDVERIESWILEGASDN